MEEVISHFIFASTWPESAELPGAFCIDDLGATGYHQAVDQN